jgi:hypothetical protein
MESWGSTILFNRRCPRCLSWEIYKSRSRRLDFFLQFVLLRPVRCGDCNRRYYRAVFMSVLDRGEPRPRMQQDLST